MLLLFVFVKISEFIIFFIFKRNPQVSRQFFSRTSDGIREDRPAFRLSKKVSHEKEDHELLLTATKKPPISSKN